MNSQPAKTEEPLADGITPAKIKKLKAKRKQEGARKGSVCITWA